MPSPAPRVSAFLTVSLHDALPISAPSECCSGRRVHFCRRAQVKQTGGAVPHGAALCAPATKSLPPPTPQGRGRRTSRPRPFRGWVRSEEHTSELQSRENLVCRLLLRASPRSSLFRCTTLFRSPLRQSVARGGGFTFAGGRK